MAIDKDFVIKNGLQVSENLIYADPDTDRVGLGTTNADKRLVVIGDQETSQSLSVGTTVTAQRLVTSGVTTAVGGIDVGVAGTIFHTQYNATDINGPGVGINSTDPRYTLEVIGPVSIGDTAGFIYGDLTVTGDIRGTSLSGQIAAGGTVGFTNVTVENKLDANNAEIYSLFRIQEFGGDRFKFLSAGDPPGIGFTQNQDDPEIYVIRGQTYRFDVDSGGFPFYIKRQPTADLNNIYNDGVVNNGVQVGIVTFKVPFNSPNILYYQASNTAGMGGTIYVDNDNKTYTVGVLTVSQFFDSDTQADFEQIYVSGIGTINNLKGPNFSVSAGILTVRQDQTALIGVSTGTDFVSIQEKSDNVNYQVPFTPTLGIGSNYQNIFVDSEDGQMMYNPSTNYLTVNRVFGNLSGIATGADNINIDGKTDSTNYQITFSDPGTYGYERQYIDSQSDRFVYNPATNTLEITNIKATTVTAGLAGTAFRADYLQIDPQGTNTNYQVPFIAPGGTGYQRLFIHEVSTNFTFNPSSNTLTAGNLAGRGDNLTNLDASNLSQGTVNNDRLIKASTTVQGIVQLDNLYPPTSSSTTQTATTNISRQLYNELTGIIPSGTVMLFYQSTAPTGWTRITNQNNKAIRVVGSGGGGTGGSNTFTSAFASVRTVPVPLHDHPSSLSSNNQTHSHSGSSDGAGSGHDHSGTANQDAGHGHSINDPGHAHSYVRVDGSVEYGDRGRHASSTGAYGRTTGRNSTGVVVNLGGQHTHSVNVGSNNQNHSHSVNIGAGGAGHEHGLTVQSAGVSGASMNFEVQYIDVIIASKNAY